MGCVRSDELTYTVEYNSVGAKHWGAPHAVVILLQASNVKPQLACNAMHETKPGHGSGVELLEPGAQKKPSAHFPEHKEEFKAIVDPYVPLGHNTGALDAPREYEPSGADKHETAEDCPDTAL